MTKKMTEKYEPKLEEIIEEIKSQCIDFGRSFASEGLNVALAPHFLPTSMRKGIEYATDCSSNKSHVGSVMGLCVGLYALASQSYAYYHFAKNGHPEILAVPIVTNLASGIYELYKNAKDKIIEKKEE